MDALKIIATLYLVMSVLTFFVYGVDKSAARSGRWRIRENSLHFLALCCGWPGALLAQSALRHKTRKQPFQAIFWLTVLLNSLIFGWIWYKPFT